MYIDINDNHKLVSIWLTNKESNDNAIREELKPLYAEYTAKKYKVAVFESGNDKDLYGLTEILIKDNKYKLYKDNTEAPDKVVGF